MRGRQSQLDTQTLDLVDTGGRVEQGSPRGVYVYWVHTPDLSRRARAVALPFGEVVIGREASISLPVRDTRVSKQHLAVRTSKSGAVVTDLGSRNGTFVNGQRLQPHTALPLAPGDLIRLGNSVAVVGDGPAEQIAFAHPHLPGRSPAVRRARSALSLASSAQTVLILGETGTGKTYAAEALRGAGPLVALNCAELTRGLSRAELFGVVRGAFTGATESREGLLSRANGGTLLLDEIGDLDLDVQGELLRVIETRRYRRVGGTHERLANVRVVAATHVPLDEAVTHGRFRQDLLARLCADQPPVCLPPLRERREDLLGWARQFAGESVRFEAGFVEAVLLYSWPTNLRGLRQAVKTAATSAGAGASIGAGHLPPAVRDHRRQARVSTLAGLPVMTPVPTPSRRDLEAALQANDGNMVQAARQLGVERRTMYRLCSRHEVDYAQFRRRAPR